MGHVEHTYRHGVDAVFAALTDADHLRRRCEAAGQRNIDVDVQRRGDLVEVRIARDIESDIPSFAKKVVDPVNRVVDVLTWRVDGDGRIGSYRVEVSKRIGVTGTVTLRPVDGGCRSVDAFTAKVDMPLIGKKIAALVEEKTESGIRADCAFTERELSRS